MALDPGTAQRLENARAYKGGQITFRHLAAFIRDFEEKMNAGQSFNNPIEGKVTNANGTAQIVTTGAGTLFRCRVENSDNEAVIVLVSDGVNAVIIGAVHCPAAGATGPGGATVNGCGEFDVNGGTFGFGVPFATDLRVRAFKASDGTTGADNGCTVFPLYTTAL